MAKSLVIVGVKAKNCSTRQLKEEGKWVERERADGHEWNNGEEGERED